MKTSETNLVKGRLSMHKRGFGFLRPEDPELEDVFIPPNAINGALDGDTVLVEVHKSTRAGDESDKQEGSVSSILTRGVTRVVGEYKPGRNFGLLHAASQQIIDDIFRPKKQNLGAVDGHKVLVEITKYREGEDNPEGHVIQILGHKNDPGVDILSIIYQRGIAIALPEQVLRVAIELPVAIGSSE